MHPHAELQMSAYFHVLKKYVLYWVLDTAGLARIVALQKGQTSQIISHRLPVQNVSLLVRTASPQAVHRDIA